MPIINEALIQSLLTRDHHNNTTLQRDTIEKAGAREHLTLEDVAILLAVHDPELREEIHRKALAIKQEIYGNRLVFFAPLYLTNRCVNNCLYCSFRRENTDLERATLSQDEIRREVEYLLDQGHKRLLLVAGEHPKEAPLDYIGTSISTVYGTRRGGNNIRRVNINAAPMSLEDFRTLKTFGIGTYQCFQETYHRETYGVVHPSGFKSNYDWRVTVMDRAMAAGIDDVGVGVLFGLYDYRFETLALMQHIQHLEQRFDGVGPHTISIPRLEPALHAPLDSTNSPWTVSDEDFLTLVAILRLAVPYTGMILSTRENPGIRRKLFDHGISQISAGSKTDPGGYQHADHEKAEQFQLGDHRTVDEVIRDVVTLGYMPSFCTSCYRSGRTGDRFMDLAKSGNIGKICAPNALATFEEYLNDYAGPETREVAKPFIASELEKLPEGVRKKTQDMIERIDDGERDVYL
jgi:2-iminoacetate synthase